MHKGPLLTGGVRNMGWLNQSLAYFLWQMWHVEPLHRLRFQLICILRPPIPIPEVNDDVAAVCKFNDAGNVKLESFLKRKYWLNDIYSNEESWQLEYIVENSTN